MATVIGTSRYKRQVKRLLTESEQSAMEDAISVNPEAHPIVPGTGGIRKARWGRQGAGKRGGVRVIYYFWISDDEIYLIHIYSKNEQADMNAVDRKRAKRFVEELKRAKEEKKAQQKR